MAQLHLISKLQAEGAALLKSNEIDLSLVSDNIMSFMSKLVTRRKGRALLHIAAEEGKTDVVRSAIRICDLAKHDLLSVVNAQDTQEKTALFHAAENGQMQPVRQLLAAGAELNIGAKKPPTLDALAPSHVENILGIVVEFIPEIRYEATATCCPGQGNGRLPIETPLQCFGVQDRLTNETTAETYHFRKMGHVPQKTVHHLMSTDAVRLEVRNKAQYKRFATHLTTHACVQDPDGCPGSLLMGFPSAKVRSGDWYFEVEIAWEVKELKWKNKETNAPVFSVGWSSGFDRRPNAVGRPSDAVGGRNASVSSIGLDLTDGQIWYNGKILPEKHVASLKEQLGRAKNEKLVIGVGISFDTSRLLVERLSKENADETADELKAATASRGVGHVFFLVNDEVVRIRSNEEIRSETPTPHDHVARRDRLSHERLSHGERSDTDLSELFSGSSVYPAVSAINVDADFIFNLGQNSWKLSGANQALRDSVFKKGSAHVSNALDSKGKVGQVAFKKMVDACTGDTAPLAAMRKCNEKEFRDIAILLVKKLMSNGEPVDGKEPSTKAKMLHYASMHGDVELVTMLLEEDTNPSDRAFFQNEEKSPIVRCIATTCHISARSGTVFFTVSTPPPWWCTSERRQQRSVWPLAF